MITSNQWQIRSMKMKLGTMIKIDVDGTETFHPSPKMDFHKAYELIGCDCVAMIKVRYRGKVRDALLDDNGFMHGLPINPRIKELAYEYYRQPIQDFVGPAVIWVPNQEITE